ncbi:hypothetical protein Rhow_006746 [Rhodococcus wratislaviensis]|uniref:Uncharacterized protein n=1 Tax=Rhodococcus wratislaviensis TaxID=44752 RepID=A0A402CGD4_RHOWR|nr:hypothetical protein Rhow_006746 [Rhodococcus wratislaviensis]
MVDYRLAQPSELELRFAVAYATLAIACGLRSPKLTKDTVRPPRPRRYSLRKSTDRSRRRTVDTRDPVDMSIRTCTIRP